MASNFTSVFHLNGIPILPPLMTDEIREEMKKYKEMASQIEKKLMKKKFHSHNSNCEYLDQLSSSESNTESNYQNTGNISIESESLDYLQLSSMMNTTDPVNSIDVYKSPVKDELLTQKLDPTVTDAFSKIPLDTNIFSLDFPMSKSVPGTNVRSSPVEPKLVRSNSYTILHPSPSLLKHLQDKGFDSFDNPQNSISNMESHKPTINLDCQKPLAMPKLTTNPNKSSITPKKNILTISVDGSIRKSQSSGNVGAIHKKKSPYDTKLVPRPKPLQKKLATANTKVNSKSTMPKDNPPKETNQDIATLVNKIEEEHRNQIVQLLQRQKEEQLRMEKQFNLQQQLLLQKIQESMEIRNSMNLDNLSQRSWNRQTISECGNNNSFSIDTAIAPVSQVLLEQYLEQAKLPTPPKHCKTTNSMIEREPQKSPDNDNNKKSPCSRRLFPPSESFVKSTDVLLSERNAATKINAFARGYLVRRLFKTEELQKLIQLVKESFHLLLDLLCDEANENNPTIINLEKSLLYQMRRDQAALFNILFDIPIKARMKIIQNDREVLKKRLRMQNISHADVKNSLSRNLRQNNLQIIKL